MSNTNIDTAKSNLTFAKINLIDVMNLAENEVEQSEQELRRTILEEGYRYTDGHQNVVHPELEGCEGWVHTSFAQSKGEITFSIYTYPTYEFISVTRIL